MRTFSRQRIAKDTFFRKQVDLTRGLRVCPSVHENNDIRSHQRYFLRFRSTNISTRLHSHSRRYLTIFTQKCGNRIVSTEKARTSLESESRQTANFRRLAFFSRQFQQRRKRSFEDRVNLPSAFQHSSLATNSTTETRGQREPERCRAVFGNCVRKEFL